MEMNMILGLSNVGVALLLIVVSIPLVQRKVKMNHFYGVRIAKAFESEENWYKINAYGGRRLVAWSVVLAVIGVITFFLPLGSAEHPNETLVLAVSLAPLIVIVPCVAQILWYSKKL